MNGPAKNFTLYPDQPEHLAYWLRNQAERDGWRPPAGVAYADSFAPRHLYGDYVQAELENALAQAPHPIAFKHLAGRARDLDGDGAARWAVRLEDGRQLRADYVVLATGLFPRTLHETGLELDPELVRRGAVIDDLWSEPPPKALARDRDVLVIGSNLSALDAMIHADSHGFRGEFHSVSRRGLLVAPRRDVQPWPSFLDPQALPATLRDLLRAVQAARRDIASAGEDWQRLAGAVRPHLPALWTAASADERLRFIRHLRPYWELGLHRAAPESNAWLQDARRAGRFRHHAGRVLRLSSAAGGRVAVSWRARRIASADPAGGPRIQHARFRVRLDPHRRRAAAQSAGQGPGRAARNRFRHRRGPRHRRGRATPWPASGTVCRGSSLARRVLGIQRHRRADRRRHRDRDGLGGTVAERGGNRLLPVGRNGPGPAGRQGRLTCSPSRR